VLFFEIPTRSVVIGRSLRGKPEILEKTYKCRRYLIGVNGLDMLSLGDLGAGVQCFGKFGAFGHSRTMTIGRQVRELHKLT